MNDQIMKKDLGFRSSYQVLLSQISPIQGESA